MNVKAVPVEFDGVVFRSTLEARWAYFLRALKLDYQYEPRWFQLPCGLYLPDFFVPSWNTWVEIKPRQPVPDHRTVQCAQLREYTKQRVLVLHGFPGRQQVSRIVGGEEYGCFGMCGLCGSLTLGSHPHKEHLEAVCRKRDGGEIPMLEFAYKGACGARFSPTILDPAANATHPDRSSADWFKFGL